MQINFNTWVIICGALIVLGIFAAILLWFKKDRLLSLLILTTSLWLIHTFYSVSGIFQQNANFYFQPIYYSFAFGPLIYFYTRSLVNHKFTFHSKYLLHFIPVLLQGLLYWFLFMQDYGFKNSYWHDWHFPYTYRIEFIGTFVSLSIYTVLSLRLLRAYQRWLKNHFSESSKLTLNWLRLVLTGFFLLSMFWFAEVIMREVYTTYGDYTVITLGVLTLILTIGGLLQEKSSDVLYEAQTRKSEDLNEQYLALIKSRMEKEQDYLTPTLTLKEFSKKCKLPARTISQHINQGFNQTFHDFVNGYRVEDVKKKLLSTDRQKYTLESIAYDCGFNSKATFNRIFKKYTGVSPSNYKGT